MIRIRKGKVRAIDRRVHGITIADVEYDGKVEKAINYDMLSGEIHAGDVVYINTTASYLKLGSGGYDFVMINETGLTLTEIDESKRIMKMKYTPFQINFGYTIDESTHFESLYGMVVMVGELHSMLAPSACTIRYLMRDKKIAYIMTDGGCLPISFSFSVSELKSKGIIHSTITYGNAFGGDYEAINLYDALIIAKTKAGCDAAIVTMGPGILGTGTKFGFSGIEQGYIIDGVNNLGGVPVFIPRISFSDKRKRHYGISHHTITVLTNVALSKAHVVFPKLGQDKTDFIKSQIMHSGINQRHNVFFCNSSIVFKALKFYNVDVSTMGRSLFKDREFFMACGSAAEHTAYLMGWDGVS